MSSGVVMRTERMGDALVLTMSGLLQIDGVEEATRLIRSRMSDAGAVVIDMRGAVLVMDTDADATVAMIAGVRARLDVPLVYVVSPAAQHAIRGLCRRLARHGLMRVATCSYGAACRWATAMVREAREPALP
jgi:hypothetical protein